MKQLNNDLYCLLENCDKEEEEQAACENCENCITFVDFAEIQERFIKQY